MKKLFLVLVGAAIQLTAVCQSYWQQEVHYTIDVSLNDQEHSLEGFLKLQYVNHSPDTLSFIWFHLWPNAFKNDKTAFTEQTLQNGRIDYYFASREQRGYINRLDFRVNNNTCKTEDHPQYIDIVKVYLPEPLAPGAATALTTPFHVQLPYNFSRGGHVGKAYQVTQWYPKPAVYDRMGWHPMPYLDQGEFYSDFGSFDVRITVPETYAVAATGILQEGVREAKPADVEEANRKLAKPPYPARRKPVTKKPSAVKKKSSGVKKKPVKKKPGTIVKKPKAVNRSQQPLKTLRFTQDKIHDFAWFADTSFVILHDTIQIDNRVVDAYSYYYSKNSDAWKKSIQHIKDAVRFRSNAIGAYPYTTVTVVEAKMGFEGGMEYPTITSISPGMQEKDLDMTIEHEIGHNWFYGILASNERDHPWMDEGINTYYDNRYKAWKYPTSERTGLESKLPNSAEKLAIDALAKIKKDQPVTTASADFTSVNYGVIAYLKTGVIMQQIEEAVGKEKFDSCMQVYYQQWQFKHPYPQDFQNLLQSCTSNDLTPFFNSMHQTGPVTRYTGRKKLKPAFLFSFKDYERTNYINWMPAIGYNSYDKFMVGLGIHNYTLPAHKFQYFLAPLYATGSKQLNGIGQLGYTWHSRGHFSKVEASVAGARFSTRDGVDSNFSKVHAGFYKVAPALRLTFNNPSLVSNLERWLEWKTFIIGEQDFRYVTKQSEGNSYPTEGSWKQRYLNQLSFAITNYRALYPYDALVQVQQGDGFYRATATGHYFFNYGKTGGLQMRVFAAKFGYLGEKSLLKEIQTEIYQPKLTAVRGYEDYTYSNYFIGRNEIDGILNQQIMIRDGGLKLRTDLFQGLQGRSDDWVASINLNTTLPKDLVPFNIPLRLFLDVGTYAEAWEKDAYTGRFLYVGGLQLSLFKDLLNIYMPLMYSKAFRDNLKTVPEENKIGRKISFSIDVHRFNLRKVTGNKIPF